MSLSSYTFLSNHRRIKYVERLAGSYKLRPYNNADHQYFVGIMYLHFSKLENIENTVEVVEKVFCHDAMELYTGDLLYPAKNLNPKTKHLWNELEKQIESSIPTLNSYSDSSLQSLMSDKQWNLFKACDILELWCFCMEEKKLGNVSSQNSKVINKCSTLIEKHKTLFSSIYEFMEHFESTI